MDSTRIQKAELLVPIQIFGAPIVYGVRAVDTVAAWFTRRDSSGRASLSGSEVESFSVAGM